MAAENLMLGASRLGCLAARVRVRVQNFSRARDISDKLKKHLPAAAEVSTWVR